MALNAMCEKYDEVELFGKPALFSNFRINRATVPDGLYCYDLRGSDYDPGRPIRLENFVAVNHAATVITAEPVRFAKGKDSRMLRDGLNFLGGSEVTLAEFCKQHGLEHIQCKPKYAPRPASIDEAELFYAMKPEQDEFYGCIGHVRIDFGQSGNEFWHSWWERGSEELNNDRFKAELAEVVDELRKSVLADMIGMRCFCRDNGGYMDGCSAPNYCYMIDTKDYRYCLRCIPMHGDYNAYLTCYDRQVMEMNMKEQENRDIQMGGM